MRFEHNLPVLVQLRWLPVGGPYAAFNLPVRFSPMSIGAGGWLAEMAQEPRPRWCSRCCQAACSAHPQGPPAGPHRTAAGQGRQLAPGLAVARGSLPGRPSPEPSLGLPLRRDACQGSRPGTCQRSVQTSHFPHSFFNWIFGPAGQNKLSTGKALWPLLNARWCLATLGG